MDDTMFGRWVVSSLADPTLVIDLLRDTGSTEAAHVLEDVRRALGPTGLAG